MFLSDLFWTVEICFHLFETAIKPVLKCFDGLETSSKPVLTESKHDSSCFKTVLNPDLTFFGIVLNVFLHQFETYTRPAVNLKLDLY